MRVNKFTILKKSFILILFAVVQSLFSQSKGQTEYSGFFDSYYFRGPLNILLGGGVSAYNGDLSKPKPSYVFGGGVSYKVWPRTYFGAQLNYLNLAANDGDSIRNISFTNNMTEFYAYCRFNILDRKMLKNMDIKRKEMSIRPYLTLGIGTNRYSVTSKTTNPDWDKDAKPENAKYPKFGFFIPAGVGIAFFVTHRISILAEFNYRYPFTDYLDDVSARGNSKKDIYYTGELKIQYSPMAPKRKKKHKFTEPAPYGGKVTGPPAPKTAPDSSQQNNVAPADSTAPAEQPAPDPNAPSQDNSTPQEQPIDDGWGTPPPEDKKKDKNPK